MKETLKFGRYLYKGKEVADLEWLVLDETPDGKKLLITRDCIEVMRYEYPQNRNPNPHWTTCVIRLWLNKFFTQQNFTEEERARMLPIPVKTPRKSVLKDKVTLLSAEEALRYFPDQEERRAKPTPRAKRPLRDERICVRNGYCYWYLRELSERCLGNWTAVTTDGSIDEIGADIYLGRPAAIRPVIMIK